MFAGVAQKERAALGDRPSAAGIETLGINQFDRFAPGTDGMST
jgi:hypothetical protein